MTPNRITRGGATLAALLLVALLGGCGGGGASTAAPTATSPRTAVGTSSTKVSAPTGASQGSPDAELLDNVLARQEAAVAADAQVARALPPRLARMAAYFRAQEQEHVDATIKALRGLDAGAEPIPEPIDASAPKSDRERLVFLYEVESATIDEELSAISKLEAASPRSLLASTVANQAQHLTLLRQALGSGPLASAPVPFENGTAPPPGE
jgi:hypothetical protein